MSSTFKQVRPGALAAEAAKVMQDSNVYVLIVIEEDGKLCGILKMHDLLQANVL